jgi:hypothetical protein
VSDKIKVVTTTGDNKGTGSNGAPTIFRSATDTPTAANRSKDVTKQPC